MIGLLNILLMLGLATGNLIGADLVERSKNSPKAKLEARAWGIVGDL